MRYITIVHELIQQQYPALHDRLRERRLLRSSLSTYAITLKSSHDAWMSQLQRERPGNYRVHVASEALELAIRDLREVLLSASTPNDSEEEVLSLDEAMQFLRRATPPA